MKSLLHTIQEPPVATALTLTSVGALLNLISVVLGIAATCAALAYTIYRWRRDALERSCDVRDCPKRHRPT